MSEEPEATESPKPEQSSSTPARRAPSNTPAKRSELVSEQGKTSIADSVVAKIAGLSCREVSGLALARGPLVIVTLGVLAGVRRGSSSVSVRVEVGASVSVSEGARKPVA